MKPKSTPLVLLFVALVATVAWLFWPDTGSKVGDPGRALQPERDRSELAGPELEERSGLGAGDSMSLDRQVLDTESLGVRVSGDGQLDGRVVQRSTGLGAAGVNVELYSFPPQGADLIQRVLRLAKMGDDIEKRARPLARTVTETDGSFHFEGVRAGSYFAEARGERFVPDPIERVTLAPGGGEVTLFVRAGGRVVGEIKRPDGRPAAGARVYVGQGEGVVIPALKTGDILLKQSVTDARGRFAVGGLPPGGGFQVSATLPDLGFAFAGGLEVRASGDTQVELTFRAPASITGRVFSSLEDAEGAEKRVALVGAQVAAVPRGLREMQFLSEMIAATQDTSGPGGTFRLSALPPGEVDLIAWAPGHMPARLGPLPSSPGVNFDAGDVALKRGPLARGRVVDTAGQPIEGVQVRWELARFDQEFEFSIAPLLYQALEGFEFPLTDEDGRFEAGPFPGNPRHRLYFFRVGYEMVTERWSPEDEGELRVVLRRGGAVEGIVIDTVAKRPVTRFEIGGMDRIDSDVNAPAVQNPFGGGQLVEDPKGRFRVPAVQTGTRRLTFSAEGYQSRVVEGLEVKEGEDLRGVIVQLEPGATVRGRVLDGEGNPVAGARLAATQGNGLAGLRQAARGGPGARGRNMSSDEIMANVPMGVLAFGVGLGLVRSALSDQDGVYELRGLGPGEWTVAGNHRDYSTGASEPVEIVFEESGAAPVLENVDVTMETGCTLFGDVRDRRGAKLPRVMVIAFSPAGFASGKTAGGVYQDETDAEGRYRLENMVAGGYFLLVTRGDEHLDPFSFLGTMQFDLVTVPDSGEVQHDLVDQSAASTRVHGLVLQAGVPVSGGAVMALNLETDNMLGVDVKVSAVGRDGAYEFPGLPEGVYQFRYQGRGDSVGREVEVPDLTETRIDLHLPDGVVSGIVVSQADGKPVSRAEVRLRRLDTPLELEGLMGSLIGNDLSTQSDWTGSDGTFLLSGLEAGLYELTVRGARWVGEGWAFGPSEPLQLEVREGLFAERLTIELPPTLAIRGSVRDAGGAPVPKAQVVAIESGRLTEPFRTRAGDDGRFELRGVGIGVFDLTARAEGFATSTEKGVQVNAEGGAVDFVLWRGVEVRVRVLTPSGEPAVGAVASLELDGEVQVEGRPERALENWFVGRGVADLEGLVNLGRFAPGRYLLEASRGKLTFSMPEVEVPEAGVLELEVRLE